ncbi:hypothetical protein [Kitasatospora sp. NPDC047058]|uniref:hypothetical protein n=1 Tax=Kitasatospora sp. NPDC047058 TaxID=3155620 RepID=UPI0033F47C88
MDTSAQDGRPAPGRIQRSAAGRALRLLGFVLQVAGSLLVLVAATRTLTSGVMLRSPYRSLPVWQTLLVTAGMLCTGGAALYAGRRLSRHGRRHTTRILGSPDEAGPEPFVLYLRPFAEDRNTFQQGPAFDPAASALNTALLLGLDNPGSRTFEERIARTFRRFGRVIAVGQPGERLPLPGADKLYLPLNDWQPVVSDLIHRARLVVLVAGPGPGTLWEFTEAVRLLPPARLVLLVLPDAVTSPPDSPTTYDRFRQAVPPAFAARAVSDPPPRLPECPPLRHPDRMRREPSIRGFVRFGPAWTPEFVRLDPTAFRRRTELGVVRRLTRTQLEPFLTRVQRTLP